MSRRVSFSSETDFVYTKHGVGGGGGGGGDGDGAVEVGGKNKKATLKIWIFKIRRRSCAAFSPASFLRHIGAKVAGALPFISTTTQKRCSRKVSSSASLVRSRSYAETLDSQRAEAIEDCIEFLNSSSLQRSNSVASSC